MVKRRDGGGVSWVPGWGWDVPVNRRASQAAHLVRNEQGGDAPSSGPTWSVGLTFAYLGHCQAGDRICPRSFYSRKC